VFNHVTGVLGDGGGELGLQGVGAGLGQVADLRVPFCGPGGVSGGEAVDVVEEVLEAGGVEAGEGVFVAEDEELEVGGGWELVGVGDFVGVEVFEEDGEGGFVVIGEVDGSGGGFLVEWGVVSMYVDGRGFGGRWSYCELASAGCFEEWTSGAEDCSVAFPFPRLAFDGQVAVFFLIE